MFLGKPNQFSGSGIGFLILDCTTTVLAIFANVLVLIAVLNCSLALTGHRRFLISLTACDLFVCGVNVLTFSYQIIITVNQVSSHNTATSFFSSMVAHRYFKCGANILRTLQRAGFFANLLNLCGMSIDSFIGVVYPIQYRSLMEKNAVKKAIKSVWIVSFLLAITDVFVNTALYYSLTKQEQSAPTFSINSRSANGLTHFLRGPSDLSSKNASIEESLLHRQEVLARIMALIKKFDEERKSNKTIDACTFYHETKMLWFEIAIMGATMICLLFLTVCYGIILKKVRESIDASGRHVSKKSVITAAILLSAFVICWMPFTGFELGMLVHFKYYKNKMKGGSNSSALENLLMVQNILNSLLRTYPLLDPLIYAIRIPAVQQYIMMQLVLKFPRCCVCCINNLTRRNRRNLVNSANTPVRRVISERVDEIESRERSQDNQIANNHIRLGVIRDNSNNSSIYSQRINSKFKHQAIN